MMRRLWGKIGQMVAAAFDHPPQLRSRRVVCAHIQEDTAGVTDQSIGPIGDYQGADDAHDRIHEIPAQQTPEEQLKYRKDRNRRIGCNVNASRAHIVVAHCGGRGAATPAGLGIVTLMVMVPSLVAMFMALMIGASAEKPGC
jgi:hypothetical protein